MTKRITNIELPKYFLSKTEIPWHKESIEYYFVKEVSIIKDVIIADAVRTPVGNHDGMIRDFNPVVFGYVFQLSEPLIMPRLLC